jgi:hypothetical protein
MNVRRANDAGRKTVRRGSTKVHCKLPLLIDAVLPKGLQQQGNP